MSNQGTATAISSPEIDPVQIIVSGIRETAQTLQARMKAGHADQSLATFAGGLFILADTIEAVAKRSTEVYDDDSDL